MHLSFGGLVERFWVVSYISLKWERDIRRHVKCIALPPL